MKKTTNLVLLSFAGATNAFVSRKSGCVLSGSCTSTSSSSTELFERKAFITGNWKLNPQTKAEAVDLARGIAASISDDAPCDVGLFVPFPFIETVQAIVGDKILVGAEVSSKENRMQPPCHLRGKIVIPVVSESLQ